MEKMRQDLVRCVPMETNENEPSKTCRKTLLLSKPGGSDALGINLEGTCYLLRGNRHKGGVNVAQALVWNVGTYAPMLRENSQVEVPLGGK